MPSASNARCANAVTDPLPLVPAICSEEKLRSGWPSAAHRRLHVLQTQLDPEVLEREQAI